MKTKIVYVLVSSFADCYYEQLLISLYSMKIHNPSSSIIIVTDDITFTTLTGQRSGLYEYNCEVKVIEVPVQYSPFQRSRYLKTRLREFISGDFLYVDTDTVICSDISEIDTFKCDVGAVKDKNRPMKLSRFSGYPYEMAKKAGLASELLGEPYYNGGLLYVKDSPTAHAFYREWYSSWLLCLDKGLNIDQTGLCLANKKLGRIIEPIDYKWNCQINSDGLLYTKDAYIIHYFSDKYPQYLLSRRSVQETIKEFGSIPPFVIDFINNPKLVFTKTNRLLAVKIKKLLYPLYIGYRYIKGII